MISLVVSGVGAIVAAVGSGVLLARCFREPRGDIVAWSIALLGLLVSLGSQALGHLAGFDSAMFRGMEVGGQVIAPLALILGMSEVAAKKTAVRFCARLYIPALAIVALVILGTDQLAQATFSKAWPDPSVFYQLPPDYVLMFAIGPITALIAIIAAWTVIARSSEPSWDVVRIPQLMAGVAALALAYPSLAQLVAYLTGTHLPVSSAFAVVCTLAAGLTWAAGVRTGGVRLAVLHGSSSAIAAAGRDGTGRDGTGRDGTGRGRYRDDEEYWQDRAGQSAARSQRGDRDLGGWDRGDWDRANRDNAGYGWQDDRNGELDGRGMRSPDERDGRYGASYDEPDFATGDFATGDLMPGELANADHDLGYQRAEGGDRYAGVEASHADRYGERDRLSAAAAPAATETRQAELFGQIAIYTVLEDRVDEFDQLTGRVVEQVRSREPDTLVFIVHAVPSAPMQRILYEVYRDRAAYQWHSQQPYVRQFEADRRPYVLATNVIELGLQQAKVSPFPSVADLFGEPGYDTSGFERPDFLRDYGRTSGQHEGAGGGDFR
jgi:quinol monooxygenase YgiN/branched-subunit amino acid transport protein